MLHLNDDGRWLYVQYPMSNVICAYFPVLRSRSRFLPILFVHHGSSVVSFLFILGNTMAT